MLYNVIFYFVFFLINKGIFEFFQIDNQWFELAYR